MLGGLPPIVSVLVGDEGDTLAAGRFLFDQGYYVQSVVFPAVPYHAGVLRIQANANHTPGQIDGLLGPSVARRDVRPVPRPRGSLRPARGLNHPLSPRHRVDAERLRFALLMLAAVAALAVGETSSPAG